MGTESKGRSWFGKIYNKLEMILMEVDTFTSKSTFCLQSNDSIIRELEKLVEDPFTSTWDLHQHHKYNRLALPTCDPPLHHILGNVHIKKRVEDDCFKETSSGDICSATTPLHNLGDDVIDGKSDVAPLDTIAFVDDNALYALCVRTNKLRSVKRRILDVLNSKRRREKEYEQLAIWFGDADMGSDLATGEDSKQVEAMDSDDSQWELL